jgi:predicted nuclease of predicted toxin-antitoxin system
MLKILLDENLPPAFIRLIQEHRPNWTVSHVLNLGLGGSTDEQLFAFARTGDWIVLTLDADFSDSRLYPLDRHPGVVRLRLPRLTKSKAQHAIERLLNSASDEDLAGNLVIVDAERIRIRRPSE